MESIDNKLDAATPWRNRRRRLRLECRECEVVCERVVSPWQCLRSNCPYVYSYHDGETTYFGCLHKVFSPELDLRAFTENGGASRRRSDPYGPLRVNRTPLSHCRVWVEQAYGVSAGATACCNPTFFHDPSSDTKDSIRLTARAPKVDEPSGD